MIHTSLSPNTQPDDLLLAFSSLFLPWNWFRWRRGKSIKHLESQLKNYLSVKHSKSFQRGRDALYILLKALGIGEGDEVILQGYTCIVVPNAIQYTGAKPIYVDIEKNGFNIDPECIEAAISERTKAVIVQHTFGEPADIYQISSICKRYSVSLIEDCAHALSASYRGKPVGSFGDAAMFSFGRDKVISGIWGGMVTTDDEVLAEKISDLHEELPLPSIYQIIQALLHPLVFALIKPLYHWKIGKILLVISQKLRLIPMVIFPSEKRGKRPGFLPQRMPNILARLSSHQFKKMHRFQKHRREMAHIYGDQLKGRDGILLPSYNPDAAWLRYTIRIRNAARLLEKSRKKGIYLGDWYRSVLAPECCSLQDFQYAKGSCPRAEKIAQETVNLPTHIQMNWNKVQKVIDLFV